MATVTVCDRCKKTITGNPDALDNGSPESVSLPAPAIPGVVTVSRRVDGDKKEYELCQTCIQDIQRFLGWAPASEHSSV